MSASTPITLVVTHFADLLARGLRVVIDSDASLAIVADDVAPRRLDVVLRAHRPRVAILDVDALTKPAQVRELSRQHRGTHLVLLTSRPNTTAMSQLLAFGASACLGADTQARDVLTAIHLASRGLQLTPRENSHEVPMPRPGAQLLTPREADVLVLLQEGSSNAQIALVLQVGVETIRTHARNIYRKFGVSSRRELAALPPRAALKDAEPDPERPGHHWTPPARGRQRHPGPRRR